jgi:hypothetical protein
MDFVFFPLQGYKTVVKELNSTVFGRLRQENCKFKARLGYIMSSRAACVT